MVIPYRYRIETLWRHRDRYRDWIRRQRGRPKQNQKRNFTPESVTQLESGTCGDIGGLGRVKKGGASRNDRARKCAHQTIINQKKQTSTY